jgi:hypothetical protein
MSTLKDITRRLQASQIQTLPFGTGAKGATGADRLCEPLSSRPGSQIDGEKPGRTGADDSNADKVDSLDRWLTDTACATTLSQLESIITSFAALKFSLLDRAKLGANYTEHAKRLIASENADKAKTLEHLASICWSHSSNLDGGTIIRDKSV